MYNEKTRSPMPSNRAPFGGPVVSPHGQMRDIPDEDRLESNPPRLDRPQPRRRCDGSLRNTENGNVIPDLKDDLGLQRNSHGYSCPSDCSRGSCGGWGIEARPLAMVYSPCQAWRDAYPPDVALSRGTLFSELDLPFEGSKCKRGCM